MSIERKETVACPSCGETGEFIVWQSINTSIDPEMKGKVRDRSAFAYTCPVCGKSFPVDYDFLYHQPEDSLMIWYCNSDASFAEANEIFGEGAETDNPFLKQLKLSDYIIRIVRSRNQLLEKLKIFDSGMDDRVMELVKAVYRVKLRDDPNVAGTGEVLYDEIDGAKVFVLFGRDGSILGTVRIDEGMLEDISRQFAAALPPIRKDPDRVIDFAWAIRRFEQVRPR